MMYLERTITVKKGRASINEPVILYKGDKNIEIQFTVENNPFKYKGNAKLTQNRYAQLVIKREKAKSIFSDVSPMSNEKVLFVITGEMIDEIEELGKYTFQIRLFNDDESSRGSLPIVEDGIIIKEPLCEEDPIHNPVAGEARTDISVIEEDEKALEPFDENLNYNKTEWSKGMVISSAKLNKVENAVNDINQIVRTNDYVTEDDLSNYVTSEWISNQYYITNSTLVEKDYASVDYVNMKLGDIESILKSINGEEI